MDQVVCGDLNTLQSYSVASKRYSNEVLFAIFGESMKEYYNY